MTERVVFRFGAGAACLSVVVFALCALGIARVPWLVASVVVVGILVSRIEWPLADGRGSVARRWMGLFWVVAVPFSVVYLVYAAAPEISPDGSYYHLALVRRYLDHGGFYRITTNLFASFPQGCEMLFLAAYAIGRHSAAALVHCAFLLAMPAALIAFGRRFGMPVAGVIAALLFFVSPVVGIDGSTAYVDVALAFCGFLCFYALELSTNASMLVLAGLMAGFCFAIKYTGAVAIVYTVGFLLIRRRAERPAQATALPHLALLLGAAALVSVPWLVKNWMVVDNPFSPFFNRVFPNPYVDPVFEDNLRQAMAHLNGQRLGWRTPLELTIGGGALQGLLGPAFLLAPIGLLAAKDALGRRVLAAAALFALPWFSNIGTRFLLPALPFTVLSMGMALARWPRVAAVLVVLNAIACWPWVLSTYCDRSAWRVDRFPVAAAVRMMPERQFLDTYAPDIRYVRLIQERVPADGVVYTALPLMLSYTDREVRLNFASAPNTRIEDVLHVAIRPEMQPSTRVSFGFPAQTAGKLRLVAGSDAAVWTIHEFEMPVSNPAASLNRWDATLAADGRAVTAWRSWQTVHRGAYFEFTASGHAGLVGFRTRPADSMPAMHLDAEQLSGAWRTICPEPRIETGLAVPNLRAEAAGELRRRGITHLFVHDQEPLGPDIRAHLADWQVRPAGEAAPMRLYEILPAKTIDTARELRNNTR